MDLSVGFEHIWHTQLGHHGACRCSDSLPALRCHAINRHSIDYRLDRISFLDWYQIHFLSIHHFFNWWLRFCEVLLHFDIYHLGHDQSGCFFMCYVWITVECHYNSGQFNPLCAKFFRGSINASLQFLSFFHIGITQVVGILPHVRPILHSQYHGCWWPCDAMCQGICSHDIDCDKRG